MTFRMMKSRKNVNICTAYGQEVWRQSDLTKYLTKDGVSDFRGQCRMKDDQVMEAYVRLTMKVMASD